MFEALHRNIFIPGPVGRLEAVWWTPATPKSPLAVVMCHPHPLFGGTLHNKVVYQVARTMDRLGLPVLRFNFRGAGMSEGTHDRGRGELDDVRAALSFVAGEYPGVPLVVAGFSFGCWVGLRVGCEDSRVVELIGLGAPVSDSDFSYLAKCDKQRLFVTGERDEFGPPANLERLVATFPEKIRRETQIVIVPGVDHFFVGKLEKVDEAITNWLTKRHPEISAN